MKVNARPKSLFTFNSNLNRVQLPLDDIIKRLMMAAYPAPTIQSGYCPSCPGLRSRECGIGNEGEY